MTSVNAQSFISQLETFDFRGDAIDTALRKLLAKVHLPKEAQEIDRAMEDFGKRYQICNPGLTDNPDGIYAIAFSLLMLHTDAHNKNVRQKMNKETFIMRTKLLDGGEHLPEEILDILYDNIVSTEFVFTETQSDHYTPKPTPSWFSKHRNDSNASLGSSLAQDLCSRLEHIMQAENTFSYRRTLKPTNMRDIHLAFASTLPLALSGVRTRHRTSNSISDSNPPVNTVNSSSSSSSSSMATYGGTSQSGVYTVNVAKAGILDRKYDVAFNGKKASARSWRPVGVALCGSQLFFFADTSSFQSWIDAQTQPKPTPVTRPRNRSLPLPLSPAPSIEPSQSTLTLSSTLSSLDKVGGLLQPYQICSLTDAICIYDESYTKYPHVARFITGDGQQFLLRAENDEALEDWMLKINYAATLKTAHVRPPSWDDAADPREEKVAERRKKEERMAAKIYDYTQSIRDYHASLDQDLQLRRNLMVLIPLQKSTRDRMIALAHVVAKKVRGKRIQLQRLECYREFLEKEMAAHQAQRYLGHFLPPRIMPPFMAKGYSETSFLRTLSARESMETLSIARRESTLQIRSPQDKSFPEVSCPLPLKDGLMMGNEDNSSQRSTLLDDSMSHRRMLSDSTESLLSL